MHLALLDEVQNRLLRALLHGKAGGGGEQAAWASARVRCYWRVASVGDELRIRRLGRAQRWAAQPKS